MAGSSGRSRGGVISEAEAVQQIAQLQITSNHLLRMSRQSERTIESRGSDTQSSSVLPQSTTSTTIRYDYSQFSSGTSLSSNTNSNYVSRTPSSRYTSSKYGNLKGPGG